MFKAKSSLVVGAGERTYQFICDPDSPLTEVLGVLKKITEDVQTILDEAIKNSQECVQCGASEDKILEEAITE